MYQILLSIFAAFGLVSSALAEQQTTPQVEVIIYGVTYLCPIEKATVFKDGTLTVEFKQRERTNGRPDGITVCSRKATLPK